MRINQLGKRIIELGLFEYAAISQRYRESVATMRNRYIIIGSVLIGALMPIISGCSSKSDVNVKNMTDAQKKQVFGDTSKWTQSDYEKMHQQGLKNMEADRKRFSTPPPQPVGQ
jgi:hypothetical protein